jgi:hypothetical protein
MGLSGSPDVWFVVNIINRHPQKEIAFELMVVLTRRFRLEVIGKSRVAGKTPEMESDFVASSPQDLVDHPL